MAYDHNSTPTDLTAAFAPQDAEALWLALQATWGSLKPKDRRRALSVLRMVAIPPERERGQVVSLFERRLQDACAPETRARQWRLSTGVRLIADALSAAERRG